MLANLPTRHLGFRHDRLYLLHMATSRPRRSILTPRDTAPFGWRSVGGRSGCLVAHELPARSLDRAGGRLFPQPPVGPAREDRAQGAHDPGAPRVIGGK